MRFVPFTCEQRDAMLRAAGAASVDDLFADIPASARLGRPLALPPGMSEIDLVSHLRALASENAPAGALVSFAGSGCYDHHVPSVVDHILRKPEFFTAYTPYQPEVSQGTLQAIYEYQTMVCELTGMDVSNASMYDGATALAEAAFMACRVTKRHRVLVSEGIDERWRAVLATYAEPGVMSIETVPTAGGVTAAESLAAALGEDVAAVCVASPNRLGHIEDVRALADAAHSAGALAIAASNPIMLGVMASPGSRGADIAVAEGQVLGSAMSFGGPGLGMFACRTEHVRQMPGRLVGRTVDADGADAFVLTLATREQHIRREKATSNICSNHALCALAAGAYLAAVGPEGLAGIARACMAKARHLRAALLAGGRFEALWDAPFGYEFALAYRGDAAAMRSAMLERGFLAGVPATAEGRDVIVFAATEKRTRSEIEAFAEAVSAL